MSAGFGGDPNQGRLGKDLKVNINLDGVDIILKQYKKIKKYQKSNLHQIKTLYGKEDIITSLIKEAEDNPL